MSGYRERAHYRCASRPLLKQFQKNCAADFGPKLRKNKEMEHFCDSQESRNAIAVGIVANTFGVGEYGVHSFKMVTLQKGFGMSLMQLEMSAA